MPLPLDHHDEENSAFVPTANPAHTPAIDPIPDGGWLEEAQELGLNIHSDPSMALLGGTVKAGCSSEIASITRDPVKRLLCGLPRSPLHKP